MDKLKIKITILSLILIGILAPIRALADNVTLTYTVADKQAISGDLISDISSQGLVRSSIQYDPRLFGVLEDQPLVVYQPIASSSAARPVVTGGDAIVNVTNFSGNISPGDYVTSSPITGKGMKATTPGNVLGVAVSDVTAGSQISFQGKSYTAGQVTVLVRVTYFEPTAHSGSAFVSSIGSAFSSNLADPDKFTAVIRYMIAAVIGILAFLFGFLSSSRAIAKGIEATGRNPLARRSIQISILLQVIITVLVSLGGLALSLVILKG